MPLGVALRIAPPPAEKLIQLPAFSKYFMVNALTTEHTESTEEDLGHSLFFSSSLWPLCALW